MTPQERLGKRWFLIVATLMVLGKLVPLWLGMNEDAAVSHWVSLSLALSIPFLWQGYTWLSRLVGMACVLYGGLALFAVGRDVAVYDLGWSSIVLPGVRSLVDVLAGLAFWFLPSLQAFFRYQHVGPLTAMARDDRLSPALPKQTGSFSRLVAAGKWGLAVGCGSGVLVFPDHFLDFGLRETIASILGWVAAGGVTGLVAGLTVGAAQPKVSQSTLRLALTRGLVAALACVITLAGLAAIWGGLTGMRDAPIFGAPGPGLDAATISAVLVVFSCGPPVAVAGLVLGGAVALLLRES